MSKLEGRLEQFLGPFHCLLRRNIEFAYPYPLGDNYGIYYPLTVYQTNGHCTRYTLLS
jgi:hypothetical protein